jgi:hypothetical protein
MDQTTTEQSGPSEVTIVVIEECGLSHPSVNLDVFLEPTRVALSRYHQSSASFAMSAPRGQFRASVRFGQPDLRSVNTIERERCVEEGAILFAAILLADHGARRMARIVPRGGRADYFVEDPGESGFWLLEVSGTDEGNVEVRRKLKTQQLQATPYRNHPGFRGGYVSVTRFAPPASSLLEPCEF